MKDLVIGDLHFGVKTNSITWLESEINFFNEQIFPAINEEQPDRIVFLGDIFEIRYAINQQIGIEVKKLIRQLTSVFDKPIIFVAGNHDYYCPLEEFAEYNAYDLIFGEEFKECHKNCVFVNNEPYLGEDGALFLPWYWTENPDHFDEMLYHYQMGNDVKAIYCHADLQVWPGPRIASLKGIPVYAGHIHYPVFDNFGNLYNLGAALPLTFGDANDSRHIYIIDNFKITNKIKNITTPQFKRYFNEQIFDIPEEEFNNSYMQLYISATNSNSARYNDRIKEIKTTYMNAHITTRIVDDEINLSNVNSAEGFNTNISNYIENNIPKHLTDKYKLIKEKISNNE